MKKSKKILLSALCISFVSVIVILISSPFINDHKADMTEKTIESITLPKDTEIIEKHIVAGNLVGNGNHMDYYGGVLVKSALSLDELKNYYIANMGDEVCVEEQKTQYVAGIEHAPSGKGVISEDVSSGDYYMIYSFYPEGDDIWAYLDLRAH